jgi:hypothetical protein
MDIALVCRRIFQGIYAVLLLGFFGTVGFSATYGAFFLDPADEPGLELPAATHDITPDSPAGKACTARIGSLFTELERRAQTSMTRMHEANTDAEWRRSSDTLRERLATLRAHCHLDTPTMHPVAALATALEQQHAGYDTALRSLADSTRAARTQLIKAFDLPAPQATPESLIPP